MMKTTRTRSDIEAELSRLRAATPTRLASIAAMRANRIAELEAALETAIEDQSPADPKVESALRFSRGGDRFDRRRG